jgi:hypothetical protein
MEIFGLMARTLSCLMAPHRMNRMQDPTVPVNSPKSWYRHAALLRVSAAEPLDQLISLPKTDGRLIILLLILLILSGAVAWWIVR